MGTDEDDEDHHDQPPMPPTHHPMVNRLTSTIDESLVNLTILSQDAQREQDRILYELEQIFVQLRRAIQTHYQQYEHQIQTSFAKYDQHLFELKSRLRQVREELIESFSSMNQNHDDYLFDIDKYRYLEMVTTQTLNQTMKEKKILPKYQISLNHLEQLKQIFSIQSQTDSLSNNDRSSEITPMQRSLSVG